MSMTPPNPTQGARGRVTKKAKKDTPKAAEARLPGFSIMTKDGIDVTNSAGRGTKTKEQREHAHLMRIMKACDACKKKKIRVSLYSSFFIIFSRYILPVVRSIRCTMVDCVYSAILLIVDHTTTCPEPPPLLHNKPPHLAVLILVRQPLLRHYLA
jgi:hypothetical protein